MARIDLATKFPDMKPVKGTPPLFRINGCGVALYGSRDHDPETGTYVATLCLAILFVPVVCLRAYRVLREGNSWYFVGRHPLSRFARAGNLLLVLGAVGLISALSIHSHMSTPAYKARRLMAQAQGLVEKGQLAEGAKLYQALAIAGADQAPAATQALTDLLDSDRLTQAPLSECAGVLAAAAQVGRRHQSIPRPTILNKGLSLAGARGDTDPRGGLEILDAVRPLALDTRPIDKARLPLLRKWVSADPSNLDALIALAALLEQQDQLPAAKELLLPWKGRLGTGEGARVLGTILARDGDYDGSYALLWPYVENRLGALHTAENAASDVEKQLWDREIKLLKENKAPEDFYTRYDAASKDRQSAMVHEYVYARMKGDPQLTSAQEALERHASVVPVAMELGIVMLHRAQAQSDPAARKTQLEAAEKVFLSIKGIAGESEGYRLYLGQVYYWLGRQAEGRQLFDDLLGAKGRSYAALMGIAARLRDLGAEPEARAMAEEAYGRTTATAEQQGAAQLLSLMAKDLGDEIAWLSKTNTSMPINKARLATAEGHKAYREGREDEADRQYRLAIDTYKAMPRSVTSLNDVALAYFALYAVKGDHQAFEQGVDSIQQAIALEPGDPVLLYNAGVTLMEAALGDVIGNDIDLRALRETAGVSLLGYLYHDEDSRAKVAQRVKEHPGMIRAMSYMEKVMVISPKHARAYSALAAIHQFTHNEKALQALEGRLKSANLDTSDELLKMREFLSGAKDQQQQAQVTASQKRADDRCKAVRPKGGRTAAVAVDQQASLLQTLDLYTDNVDADKVVALAEEARRYCDCSTTNGALEAAYLFRAARHLRQSDKAFDDFYRAHRRSVSTAHLMAVAASETGPMQAKVLAHPDVQSALALVREGGRRYPESASPEEWAMLKNADPQEAERLAAIIRATPRYLALHTITSLLSPASPDEALETYWLMQIHGKTDEGRDALRRVAGLGIPMPIQP